MIASVEWDLGQAGKQLDALEHALDHAERARASFETAEAFHSVTAAIVRGPIPVLDGGHIMIMALEGVARRDFSVRVKEKMLLAGFVALMLLMVTVIYNDLTRISWIERLMPWR